jgi:transposase
MARKLGNRGAGFKAKVALAAFKGDKTLAQLAHEYGAHTTQISTWKQRLLEGASELFEDRRRKRTTEAVPVDELYQQIGRLKMELEWLKKKVAPFDQG